MIRSWGIVTLTGAAQPIVGDKITAAFVVPAAGQLAKVQVASTTRYQVGDRIILGAGQTGANILKVVQIISGTILGCESEGDAVLSAWVVNTIIQLSIACSIIKFQAITGNAGGVWIGSDNTVTNVGGGSAFEEILGGGNDSIGQPPANSIRSSEGWMAGTLNDKVGVAVVVV